MLFPSLLCCCADAHVWICMCMLVTRTGTWCCFAVCFEQAVTYAVPYSRRIHDRIADEKRVTHVAVCGLLRPGAQKSEHGRTCTSFLVRTNSGHSNNSILFWEEISEKVGRKEEEAEEKSFYEHPASHGKQGHKIFVFAFWTRSSHYSIKYFFWYLETRRTLTRNKRESDGVSLCNTTRSEELRHDRWRTLFLELSTSHPTIPFCIWHLI